MTAFADGRTLTEEGLKAACAAGADSELLRGVAEAVRRLHETPAPPELLSSAAGAAGGGAGSHPGSSSRWAPKDMWRWLALAEEKGYERLPVVAEARALVESLEAVAGQPADDCFCHFDLLPDNLIRTPPPPPGGTGDAADAAAVCLIDFEYAGVGQSLMDLAIMAMGCSLDPQEEANLLAAYHEGQPPSAELLRGFAALKVLACLRETLWGVTVRRY